MKKKRVGPWPHTDSLLMMMKTMMIVMTSMSIMMMVKMMVIMMMGPGLGRLQTGHSQPLQKA